MSGCSRVHIVLLIFQCVHLQQVGVMCPVFYIYILPHLNHMECFLLSVSYTWERTTVEFKWSKVHVWKRLENLEARVVSSSFLALRKAASSHSLKYICLSSMIIRETEELSDNCSLTSLDGYSTIDQRDKDCKYKTGDGSVDLTEREPLKVWTELFWSPGETTG